MNTPFMQPVLRVFFIYGQILIMRVNPVFVRETLDDGFSLCKFLMYKLQTKI